jgi:methylenetetrahydrofolate dehydrogenase (NADP+)/methenyltetrahydrofolate cyclohydrolase
MDGKAIAAAIKIEIAKEVAAMIDADVKAPHLAAILVGTNPASETYVVSKKKACQDVGMTSTTYRLEETVSEAELISTIKFLNEDPDIDGFIVQLPLPDHINTDKIIESIDPSKDVDGFHPQNIGRMQLGLPTYLPATPFGIAELLKRSNIDLDGKHCVVLGRSNIVGTPISILLSRKNKYGNATVTLCHSRSKDIGNFTRQADVLIAAIGQPDYVKADMVKPGAIVIDVGIHRIEDNTLEKGYRLTGDVDFKSVFPIVDKITPVPGGVGPMTIVSLLQNTLSAAKRLIYQ